LHEFFNQRQRHLLLLGRAEVNAASVLGAPVIALGIERGRVVDHKENFQKFTRADVCRVIHQLHHLDMASLATAHLLVARVNRLAVAVARFHIQHTFDAHKHGFRAPEAATTEGDCLRVLIHVMIP